MKRSFQTLQGIMILRGELDHEDLISAFENQDSTVDVNQMSTPCQGVVACLLIHKSLLLLLHRDCFLLDCRAIACLLCSCWSEYLMLIRPFEADDAERLAALFHASVHQIGIRDSLLNKSRLGVPLFLIPRTIYVALWTVGSSSLPWTMTTDLPDTEIWKRTATLIIFTAART
jgi:hypothetical protein